MSMTNFYPFFRCKSLERLETKKLEFGIIWREGRRAMIVTRAAFRKANHGRRRCPSSGPPSPRAAGRRERSGRCFLSREGQGHFEAGAAVKIVGLAGGERDGAAISIDEFGGDGEAEAGAAGAGRHMEGLENAGG
jgi:hypothetical protein